MPWSIFTNGGGPEVAVGWAEQLLQLIGAPRSPGNIQFVYDWELSEGGGGAYNPLNQGPVPGQPQLTTTGSQYGGGAADYASWQAGLQGARDYLNMPNYAGIRDALLANNPVAARSALFASPWAASHYGYGARWAGQPVPGGQAVLPPAGTGPATLDSASGGDPAACAVAWPSAHIGLFFGHGPTIGGQCILAKSQARAVLAVASITAGAMIMGFGLGLTLAFTRAGRQIMAIVPGARGLAATGAAVSGPSRPGQPLTDAEVRQAKANRRQLDRMHAGQDEGGGS